MSAKGRMRYTEPLGKWVICDACDGKGHPCPGCGPGRGDGSGRVYKMMEWVEEMVMSAHTPSWDIRPEGLCECCFNPARLRRLMNGMRVCQTCETTHRYARPGDPDPTDTRRVS